MTTIEAKELITQVLTTLGYNTPPLVNLLAGTMAQESSMGQYETQVDGPALGVFQTEPNTYNDIYANFLSYHSALREDVNSFTTDSPPSPESVVNNHPYACAVAACSYIRHSVPHINDDATDGTLMYGYYKQYYNGPGAATEQEFLNNWTNFGIAQ